MLPSTPRRREGNVPEQLVGSPTAASVATAALATSAVRSFMVPVSNNPLLTGRESIIKRMRDFFFGSDHSTQKRLVLTGLGGVGKTQIATAFAYDSYSKMRYSTVLWFFAVEKQELVKSFTQVAKSLGLYPEMPPIALALLQWLSREQTSKCLLVFDNTDDLESFDVSQFFPKVPWGDILITSRCKQADRLGHAMAIDVMDEDEAVQLLLRCSRQAEVNDETLVQRLAETLGYLPLALDQAGAYVSEQCIDLSDYLELYGESFEELLRHKPPRAVWSYEETVFTTWEISYAAVSKSNPLAAKLLNLVAFFHSDGVPLALI
ncbi:P-loop containing nucleoside triphosphate hydrolase protein, partial [Lasiosphaeria hispida]